MVTEVDGWDALSTYLDDRAVRQAEYEKEKEERDSRPRVYELKALHIQDADVTFLSNSPKAMKIHSLQIDNKWVKRRCQGENCPYCMKKNKPGQRFLFYVVDHREGGFQNKDGEYINTKDSVRYVVMNPDSLQALKKILEKSKKKKLEGLVINLSKGDMKSDIQSIIIDKDPELHIVPCGITLYDWDDVFPLDVTSATEEVIEGKPRYN